MFLAGSTLMLIVLGAMVTSHDAGLSVPDWPTSFGSLYKIPSMVGGVKYEHGHRMFAEFIGLLIIVMAVWTQRVEQRKWMRVLGWIALAAVVGQGVLGGLTVLFFLPWAISTAHATLAQTIQHITRADARGEHIGELAPAIGAIVAVDRDMLDVGQRDIGFGQAISDRFAGEAAPVLDAPEALFLDGGDQGAVLHKAGGGIGVVGVQPKDIGHQGVFAGIRRSRSRRSRCMERMRSAVTRWAV